MLVNDPYLTYLQHLVRAVRGHGWTPEEMLVLSLNAYYDASGSEAVKGKESIVVAGLLATDHRWAQFEACWNFVLEQHQLPPMHATEFYVGKGPKKTGAYAAWKRAKGTTWEGARDQVLYQLTAVTTSKTMAGFLIGMRVDDLRKAMTEYNIVDFLSAFHEDAGAFSFAAILCAHQVRSWL